MQKSRFWSAAFAGMARVWNLASGRVVFGLIEILQNFWEFQGKIGIVNFALLSCISGKWLLQICHICVIIFFILRIITTKGV